MQIPQILDSRDIPFNNYTYPDYNTIRNTNINISESNNASTTNELETTPLQYYQQSQPITQLHENTNSIICCDDNKYNYICQIVTSLLFVILLIYVIFSLSV